MIAIAAVDRNWAIGNQGQLLVHISEDMKNFRRLTAGEEDGFQIGVADLLLRESA